MKIGKFKFFLPILLLLLLASIVLTQTCYADSDYLNQMELIPRGDPKIDQLKEQRGNAHSSYEPTGIFLQKDEEIVVTVDEVPEKLELRVGQWGNYSGVIGITDGKHDFASGKLLLKQGENRFSNTLTGGMVYFVNYSTTQTVHVSLSKNKNVPYFVQGETSVEEFKASLETFSTVPFMEFVNTDGIATIRMDRAKDIFQEGNQVDRFMSYVSRSVILENSAAGLDFNGIGIAKKAKQRVHVANPTNGAGKFYCTDYYLGMHSATTGDREVFKSGDSMTNWGLFHEIGHSYQNPFYTWENMGEVTVNIYADYVQSHLEGNNSPYDAIMSPNNKNNAYRHPVARYFNAMKNDPSWNMAEEIKANPGNYHFAALGMYVTLSRTFGYDFFPELNKLYRATPTAELPTNNDEKKQFFIIMASKIANRDLTPYFDFWRFTVSAETKKSLDALHLPQLEKEIWKDILATEQEEKEGIYRILDKTYTTPYADLDPSIPFITIPFEEMNDFSLEKFFSNLRSEPIASPVRYIGSDFTDPTNFNIQEGRAYFENDRLIKNRYSVNAQIFPTNTYVMSGQNGAYAALDYDKRTHELVALGNSKQILQNIPTNIYPKVTIYSAKMKEQKFYAEGYGRDVGSAFAKKLNKFKLEENDIIEIYHRESTKRVTRYIDGKKVSTTKDTYYYIITADGWKELDTTPSVQWKPTTHPIGKTLTVEDFIESYDNPISGDITFSFGPTAPQTVIKQGQTLSNYLNQSVSIKAANSLFGNVGDYSVPLTYYFEDTIVLPRHGGYGTLLTYDKDQKKLVAQGADPYTMNGSNPSTIPLVTMKVTYRNKDKVPTQIEVKNSTKASDFTAMVNKQAIGLDVGDVLEIKHTRVNELAISLDTDSKNYITQALTAFVEGNKYDTFSGPIQYFLVTNKGLKLYQNLEEMVGKVTVNYVDEQSHPLAEADLLSKKIGEPYSTTPKEITGYTLKELPVNTTGFFEAEEQTVTYVYVKNDEPGAVSIDHVSDIDFGTQTPSNDNTMITAEKQVNSVHYVQITDSRKEAGNWTLDVKQEEQFKTIGNHLLNGAIFSISNIYTDTNKENTPSITNHQFELTFDKNGQGLPINIVTARAGEGAGTWRFYFNEPTTNEPSLQLFIPGTTTKTIDSYSTKLVWTLSMTH